jgi:formate/nitrite transporter
MEEKSVSVFTSAEVAKNYISAGKAKGTMPVGRMILLGILAGAFIAIAGVGSAVAAVSVQSPSLAKLVTACIFPGGLTMCILGGAELFTGNCLMSIPLAKKEITAGQMLRNWGVVWVSNLIGGLIVAALVVYGHTLSLFDNGFAVSVLSTAASKCSLSFGDAFIRGICCNFLVCMAVWIANAAKDVAGKIIGLFFPIMIFVVCGFEHCVANMYYIGAGLFAKTVPAYAQAAQAAGVDLDAINIGSFFGGNLLPATLGNIIGGSVCVGLVYYLAYLKENKGSTPA